MSALDLDTLIEEVESGGADFWGPEIVECLKELKALRVFGEHHARVEAEVMKLRALVVGTAIDKAEGD